MRVARWRWRLAGGLLAILLWSDQSLAAAPVGQVLIVVEASDFKTAVATRVAEALRRDGYEVTIIKLDRLTADAVPAYHAIVVLNTCRAWRPTGTVRKFLKQLDDISRNKVVVLTTANSGECALRTPGIDAISSASKQINIDSISQALIEKVRTRLAAP